MTAALQKRILPAGIAIGILVVYLALPTRNYYWDGVAFALNIEGAPKLSSALLHPNHLIYSAAGFLEYHFIHALGFAARALTVLRVANSILSAAAAFLIFQILLYCFESLYVACVLTAAFAFSATWWKFSTDANAYVPAVLFLLMTFRNLLPGRPAKPAVAALVHSGAMLFHQLAVFFYPVAVAALWQQTAAYDFRRRVAAVAQYTAIAFVTTFGAYAAAYTGSQGAEPSGGVSAAGLLRWMSAHSPDASFSSDLVRNTLLSLRGHLRLFLGGRPAATVRQWPYLGAAIILILAVLLIVLVYRLINWSRQHELSSRIAEVRKHNAILLLATIWVTCYAVFLFVWLPGNTFYRLFYLPALVLFFGLLLARQPPGRERPVYAAALLAGMMAAANFAFDIFPNSRLASNPPLQLAEDLNRFWTPGTVVYYGSFNTDNWTIRYFHPETSWRRFQLGDLRSFEGRENNAGEAWLDTTALDLLFTTAGGFEWLAQHTPEKVRVELVNDRHRIVFQKIAFGKR